MFRRLLRPFSFAVLLTTLFQASAFAENIEGRVASVGQDSLEVTVYDPQGRPYQNTLNVALDGRTQVYGFRSLDDLNRGDALGLQVSQQENGLWHADEIQLFQEVDAKPASPQRPSSALGGALGNPVVKGALLGAATGALASGASGGKAGKGALIGAAAGGILGGLFGGDDQNR